MYRYRIINIDGVLFPSTWIRPLINHKDIRLIARDVAITDMVDDEKQIDIEIGNDKTMKKFRVFSREKTDKNERRYGVYELIEVLKDKGHTFIDKNNRLDQQLRKLSYTRFSC